MPAQWTSISQNEAVKHPLYGVKGWLLFFAIGNFLGPLLSLGQVNSIAREHDTTIGNLLSIDIPAITFLKAALFLELALAVVILFLLITKNSYFRKIAVFGRLSFWPLLGLVALSQGIAETGESLASIFIPWALSCAVWVPYLQRAERVRVTFEQCVRTIVSPNSNLPTNTSTPSANHNLVETASPDLTIVPINRPVQFDCKAVKLKNIPIQKDIPMNQIETSYSAIDEDSLYATVADELESGTTDKGLWTRLFAECGGDEKQIKVLYIKRRFEKLLQLENSRRDQIALFETNRLIQDAEDAKNAEQSRRRNAGMADQELINEVWNGNMSKVSTLLNSGISPFGVDEKGTALIDLAKMRNDSQMVDLIGTTQLKSLGVELLETMRRWQFGADLSVDEVTSLVEASRKYGEFIHMQADVTGYTLLHWCARLGLDGPATELLALGAKASTNNKDGKKAHELSRGTALAMFLKGAAKG